MTQSINQKRLFLGSCFALIATALSFAIRAGVLPQIGEQYGISATELGFINSMWFFGFPLSMILGGIFYNRIGPKVIMQVAFLAHVLGVLLTVFTNGYTILLLGTLLIGFGNGCTEAACNPMIADSYKGNMVDKMLNRFHMWFPGGIVIGSLLSKFMTDIHVSWQAQMSLIIIPAIIYFILFYGQKFPKPKLEAMSSLSENFKAMANPVFLFLFFCMALTAITEFGTEQWVEVILSQSGASPMIILALVTGTMAVLRYFAGPIIEKFGQTGVLWGGAVLSTIGILILSKVTGASAYLAAIVFAFGVALFWPTMIGAVAKRAPLTGALGLSIVGGVGMFSSVIFQPIIGGWIDKARQTASAAGLSGDALELLAGEITLQKIAIFPGILIVLFGIFFFWQKRSHMATVDEMVAG